MESMWNLRIAGIISDGFRWYQVILTLTSFHCRVRLGKNKCIIMLYYIILYYIIYICVCVYVSFTPSIFEVGC